LYEIGDSRVYAWLRYRTAVTSHLILEGSDITDSLRVVLKKIGLATFPLNSTGFHWIQEYPNNR